MKSSRNTDSQTIELPVEEIKSLCVRYHVRELSLFGSAVKNKLRLNSDVDFLVEFEQDLQVGFIAFSRMQRELASLVNRKMDLVSKNGLKPLLKDEILSGRRVLYAA